MVEDPQGCVLPLPLPPRAPSLMMEDPKDDVPGAAPCQFVNTEADNEQVLSEDSSVLLGDNQDVVLNLQYCYGLVLPFCDITVNSGQVDRRAWGTTMQVFSFLEDGTECDVSQGDRKVINTFYAAIMGPVDSEIPQDLYDLNDKNFLLLAHLQDFNKVHCISDELVVFTEPQSQACDWFLGVESAEVVLYVCRVLVSNPTHTLLTIAHCLLSKGVPFHMIVQVNLGRRVCKTKQHTYNTWFYQCVIGKTNKTKYYIAAYIR
ncbi:hypothetical protein CVT25_000810 [Psilocybe cyanescens]|uniref:Uncharacterized protein n=1 Tax=Psilocybe cyanescens TaxID=93625 RepID=A0A409XXX8_PSICY|nr:hypothetical protein CVT25_000810 [Psilocybe cyanescens]